MGHAAEFKLHGIAVDSLSPPAAIATAALRAFPGIELNLRREPEFRAEAVCFILTSDARASSGNFFIDDEVLARHGVTELDRHGGDAPLTMQHGSTAAHHGGSTASARSA